MVCPAVSLSFLFRSSVSLCQSPADRDALLLVRWVASTADIVATATRSKQTCVTQPASQPARVHACRWNAHISAWCKLLHKQPVNKATHRTPWSDRPSYRQKGFWFSVVCCLSSGGGGAGRIRRQSRHMGLPPSARVQKAATGSFGRGPQNVPATSPPRHCLFVLYILDVMNYM